MISWWNFFSKRPDPAKPALHTEPLVVTIASTSANLVIHQLTKEFTKEIEEKAGKLDITLK
jgi:hypothetical protein